jgi:hypothetical protein
VTKHVTFTNYDVNTVCETQAACVESHRKDNLWNIIKIILEADSVPLVILIYPSCIQVMPDTDEGLGCCTAIEGRRAAFFP